MKYQIFIAKHVVIGDRNVSASKLAFETSNLAAYRKLLTLFGHKTLVRDMKRQRLDVVAIPKFQINLINKSAISDVKVGGAKLLIKRLNEPDTCGLSFALAA